MSQQGIKGFGFAVLALLVGGCATTKGGTEEKSGQVTARAYITDKERVDQDMDGNYGYIYGTPVPPDRSEYKNTRKVYVLEVTKSPPQAESVAAAVGSSVPTVDTSIPADLLRSNRPPTSPTSASRRQPIVIPRIDEGPESEESKPSNNAGVSGGGGGPASMVDYTVEKGDTLQKIAKKFYNSYSKWPRIQEANQELLSNPNSIKPGMVLRIPVQQDNAGAENLK